MTYLYSIYLGTEQGVDGPIPALHRAQAPHLIRRKLSDTFGGWTQYDALGSWTDNGKRVIERSIRIDIVTDKPEDLVLLTALEAGAALRQQTVMVTRQSIQATFLEVVKGKGKKL